jgi:hypothetical protein
MGIEKALAVVNQMQAEGAIGKYAIGGTKEVRGYIEASRSAFPLGKIHQ